MKKTIAILVTLTLVFCVLAGCAKDTPTNTPEVTKAPVTGGDPGGDTLADWQEKGFVVDPSTIKVALLMDGALGDQSVHDQAYAGLMQVQQEFGVQVNYVENVDTSKMIDAMQSFGDDGYDLVVCDTFIFADALEQVGPSYPDVKFMILDTNVDVANVTSFTYATHEVSFLAGIVAAMVNETDVIGFIGGMAIPSIEKYQVGYEEGVAYVNPNATVIPKYVGNDNTAWNDPATAKSLSLDIIANGADVLFQAAGASGMGMIEACVEKNVWAIGVNIDQTHLGPEHLLTSALTKGDRAIYLFVESYLKGALLTGFQTLNCANDGVSLVESKFFTDEIKAAVADATARIISGEIKVTNVLDY